MTALKKEDAASTPPAPHHTGHRDRLRQRFLKSGPDSVADYELLELFLFTAIPRRDVKPLAKELLATFGGLPGLMAADMAALQKIKGISENTAAALKVVHALTLKTLRAEIMQQPLLSSWQKLIDYCTVAMAHEKREQLRILYLNRKNRLIADEVLQTGTIDHAPVYPREIVRRALDVGATAIILVHNHPSGDPTPSNSDLAMTEEVIRAAAALDVMVHDHIIISRNGHSSFKAMGLLEFTG